MAAAGIDMPKKNLLQELTLFPPLGRIMNAPRRHYCSLSIEPA